MTGEATVAPAWPEELVELYAAQYVGYVQLAFLLVGSAALADEIVQDAFVVARGRWADIRTSPGGYVRQVVVNGARGRLRRMRTEDAYRLDPPPPDATADLIDLRDALRRLPPPQRTAIVLRYWAQLPDEETATILDCRVGTVRSHISRGIAQLRKELS
ncbi:MAG TPA: SigE family RNA polymerase sigma factor [Acidimicrobiales bacterium]|nr:SigE family RNA polymerase sigma factor [Acidimicrobiales bacterium]